MTSTGTAEIAQLQEFASALYKDALGREDQVAIAIEKAPVTSDADRRAAGTHPIVSKSLPYLAKLVIPMILVAASGGFISVMLSKAIVDLGAIVCEGLGRADAKIDEVKSRLEEIAKGVKEIKSLLPHQGQIDKIEEIRKEVAIYWERFMEASEQGDVDAAFQVIHDAGVKPSIETRLKELEKAVFDKDINLNDSLVSYVRALYDRRLQDTNDDIAFGLGTYRTHILNWHRVLTRTHRLGTALQLVYEHCRKNDVGTREQRCKAFSKANKDFQARVRSSLGVDENENLVEFPAAQLLLAAAEVDLNHHFPQLYELHVEGGAPLAVNLNSLPAYPLMFEPTQDALPIFKAVLLEVDRSSGLWWLRTAYVGDGQWPRRDGCIPRMEWGRIKDNHCGFLVARNYGYDVQFVLIPVQGNKPVVRLLYIDTARKQRREWKVELVPSAFKYPALGSDHPDAHWDVISKYIHARPDMSVACAIDNYSPFVLVLDYAWSNRQFHYINHVWAPGDSFSVGGWKGSDLELKFRFGVYRVHAAGDVRDIVRRTYGPQAIPALGLPALNVQEKELVGYLHLRLTVPLIGYSSISAYQSETHEPGWDGHGGNLVRDGKKEARWSRMKGEFSVQSATHSYARVALYDL